MENVEKEKDKFTWGDFFILAAIIITIIALRIFVVGIYKVPSESMEPTVDTSSLIVGSRLEEPHKGDVVVFKSPEWGDTYYVKRIVAIEGNTIGGCDNQGRMIVNGKPTFEPYVNGNTGCNFPEVKIPKDRVWVMGDNRLNSADSRYRTFGNGIGADLDAGTVKKEDIVAVVKYNVGIGTLHRVN